MKKKFSSILITGASSGLGRQLAIFYAKSGVKLALFGRQLESLKQVKLLCENNGAIVEIFPMDVSDKKSMESAVLAFDQKYPLDLIIANAGIGKEDRSVIDINILGVHNTIDPIMPKFIERKSGQIALMSSLASYRGFKKYYIYSGTKAYVRIFGEGLRLDLSQYNVGVTVITPGFVKTPLLDPDKKIPLIMDCKKACKIMMKGLEKNKSVIAFPKLVRFLLYILNSLPKAISDKLASCFK